MIHSNNLGRATYVVVDDATGEAYTGSTPQHAQDQRRQAEQDRNPPPRSHSSSTSTTTPPSRRRRSVGRSAIQKAFDRQKKNKRREQEELRKKGLRSNDGDPVFNQEYVDQMNKNIQTLSSSHGKELGDLKHKLDITSYLVYGSLALNLGLIAYCVIKK